MEKSKKYKLKELWEVTEAERREIYKYAMKRSQEIVKKALNDE